MKLPQLRQKPSFCLSPCFGCQLLLCIAARAKLGVTLGSGDEQPLAVGDRLAGSKCLCLG
ncbi:hypothetical protein [Oscillatoria sp. HE19RPO]|uniref:hypothetical protein n=1 Tax=Oscillatoria sp. HE19RPO TaxID=2954806 RepID=UPI0020C3EFF7|nr:hypothetical protein [Oscillatoria sp. HE19RPO]